MSANQPPVLHPIVVSGYADVGIDESLEWFTSPGIDQLLEAALVASVGTGVSSITAQASAPERLTAGSARVGLQWQATSDTGTEHRGAAMIRLLVVQSGVEPKTELLASLEVGDDVARAASRVAHRFLDELGVRLETAAP